MRSILSVLFTLTLFVAPATADDYLWCNGTDEVRVEIDPATSDLHLFHDGAQYNCCPEPITYEVHFGDATLFIVEHVAADPPCDCNCCFDLGVTIPDAQPGPWQVTFSWLDEETHVWIDWHGQITVPDVGQGFVHGAPVSANSGCLDTTGVPTEPEPRSTTWSDIKAIYH